MEKQKESQALLIKDLHNEVLSLKSLLSSSAASGQGGLVTSLPNIKPLIPAWQLETNRELNENTSRIESIE